MDYSALWRASDALTTASAELQAFVKRNEEGPEAPEFVNTGADCVAFAPAEQTTDRMEAYRLALAACEDARTVLHDVADREGHGVTKAYARKCNVIAQRCTRAINALGKAGEL